MDNVGLNVFSPLTPNSLLNSYKSKDGTAEKVLANNPLGDTAVFSSYAELMKFIENAEDSAASSSNSGNTPDLPNFDFRNMTRKEAIDAAMYLNSKGVLNDKDVGLIFGQCCDYAAVPGYELPPEYRLDSPIKRNYFELIEQSMLYNSSNGNYYNIEAQKSLLEKLLALESA